MSAALDALYAACARRALANAAGQASRACRALASASSEVERALEGVTLADVPRSLRNFAAGTSDGSGASGRESRKRGVACLRLRAEAEYHVSAFVFDAGASIPLHNHPEMCVSMRVLFGSARVRAFDFLEEAPVLSAEEARAGRGRSHAVRMVMDETLDASTSCRSLEPRRANVHEIVAVTPCAILEVQTPPYAIGLGRDCHYFEVVGDGEWSPASGSSSPSPRGAFVLREVGQPAAYACARFNSDGEFD